MFRAHLFLLARAKARPKAKTNGGGTMAGISEGMMDGTTVGEETILGSFQFCFTSVLRGLAKTNSAGLASSIIFRFRLFPKEMSPLSVSAKEADTLLERIRR